MVGGFAVHAGTGIVCKYGNRGTVCACIHTYRYDSLNCTYVCMSAILQVDGDNNPDECGRRDMIVRVDLEEVDVFPNVKLRYMRFFDISVLCLATCT